MSPAIRVIWTALPQGLDEQGRLRLTAYASLRLTGSGKLTLKDFPAILDWPQHVHDSAFVARLFNTPMALDKVDEDDLAEALTWWQQLFLETTPVNSHVFDDLSEAEVVSYDPAALQSAIADFYAEAVAAVSSQELPTLEAVGKSVMGNVERPRLREQRRFGGTKPSRVEPFVGRGLFADPAFKAAVAKLNVYMGAVTPSSEQLSGPGPGEPVFDFHARLSALGQHAALMRLLRIAVPLRSKQPVPAGGWPRSLRVVAGWGGAGLSDQALPDGAPMTRVAASGWASGRPNEPFIIDGFLNKSKSGLGLVQLDVEGGVKKLQSLDATDAGVAQSDMALDDQLTGLPPELAGDQPAGLPALRSQGLMLAFKDQAGRLTKAFGRADTLNNALEQALQAGPIPKASVGHPDWKGDVVTGQIELYAEDLTRGFRIDVLSGTGWRSLHRRSEHYAAGMLRWSPPTETEGMVRASVSRAGVGETVSQVYAAHPALAVWTGWSLSVPHPARVVGSEIGAPDGGPELVTPANPEAGLGLAVEHDQARGLPSLRYGRTYLFRARVVDLSGVSLPVDADSPDAAEVGPERYDRFDPIEPPVVAFINDPLDWPEAGESMERLAIRSFPGDPAGPGRLSRRMVYPPRTAVDQAERHGALDLASGRIDPGRYKDLIEKDNLQSPLPTAPIPLEAVPTPGGKVAVGEMRVQRAVSATMKEPRYLPDPIAGHWVVKIEPIRAGDLNWQHEIQLAGEWPRWHGIEVRLEAGDANALLQDGVLTVTLPPGDGVRLSLSAKPPAPKGFGVWNWAEARQSGKLAPALTAAVAGQHWMLTPRRTLELIHAVQQPVVAPTFREPDADGPAIRVGREGGAREARFAFTSRVHLNSSRQIDVRAAWQEPFDAVTARPGENMPYAPPAVRAFSTQAFSRPILDADYLATDGQSADWVEGQPTSTRLLPISETQVFADTRARRVTLTSSTASRYREYMPEGVRNDLTSGPENPMALKAEAGADVWVPSASRPPAPVIVSVTPTFAWDRKGSPGEASQSSRRLGGGFRVWLDRPWFVTGFNEMLAVCLLVPEISNQGNMSIKAISLSDALTEADRKRLVSRWGLDPVLIGKGLESDTPFAFPRAVRGPASVTKRPTCFDQPGFEAFKAAFDALPEAPLRTVVTAPGVPEACLLIRPHLVDWDPERGLWFCDIELDPDLAYMPFVQLALARYQPMSLGRPLDPEVAKALIGGMPGDSLASLDAETAQVEDLHLSEPVLTDFLQLLPERRTRITVGDGHIDIRIHGVGHAPDLRRSTPSFRFRLARALGSDPDVHDLGERLVVEPIPPAKFAIQDIEASFPGDQTFPTGLGPSVSAGLAGAVAPGFAGTQKAALKDLPLLFEGRVSAATFKGRRLVIEEFEPWPTEVFDAAQQFPPGVEAEGRLVYLDQFDL